MIHAYIHIHIHALHYINVCNYIHCIAWHYITLHYITLHYITLYCITLHYVTLYDITWSKILYYLRLAQPKNQIHNAIQSWWVDGLMDWWINEFMDSWVDGYWFLVVVPEYWFPGIGSRVPYPVTQNACTIHSPPGNHAKMKRSRFGTKSAQNASKWQFSTTVLESLQNHQIMHPMIQNIILPFN